MRKTLLLIAVIALLFAQSWTPVKVMVCKRPECNPQHGVTFRIPPGWKFDHLVVFTNIGWAAIYHPNNCQIHDSYFCVSHYQSQKVKVGGFPPGVKVTLVRLVLRK